MIEQVQLIELVTHFDDRGYLYEIIHRTDDFLPEFGQTYVVSSPARGTIRGFHKHQVLWDYFHVIRGFAKFILAEASDDDVIRAARVGGASYEPPAMQTFTLSERKPSLLVVPAGIWHGWIALEDNTVLLATGSQVYNRDDPDEVRVPPDVFGDVWTVAGR